MGWKKILVFRAETVASAFGGKCRRGSMVSIRLVWPRPQSFDDKTTTRKTIAYTFVPS